MQLKERLEEMRGTLMAITEIPQPIFRHIEPEPTSGCWLWSGASNGRYGTVGIGYRTRLAHRVVYELFHGKIRSPQLDHLCRVTFCVNPDHLRQVTARENMMAHGSLNRTKTNALKTECPKHHIPYFRAPWRPTRICKSCLRERRVRRYLRDKSRKAVEQAMGEGDK